MGGYIISSLRHCDEDGADLADAKVVEFAESQSDRPAAFKSGQLARRGEDGKPLRKQAVYNSPCKTNPKTEAQNDRLRKQQIYKVK